MEDSTGKTDSAAHLAACALRLIKEQLYTFGADGDDAIQRLLSAESILRSRGAPQIETETFRAFHAGMARQERVGPEAALPEWEGDAGLRPAYETGGLAARLNARSRENGHAHGWNVGPFDHPDVRLALARADAAVRTG